MMRNHVLCLVLLVGVSHALEKQHVDLLLQLHNEHRANEGASDMNKLVWDDKLATEAQAWADACQFKYQTKGRGQNLAFYTYLKNLTTVIKGGLKAWYDQKQLYSGTEQSCFPNTCQYTQLVWAATRRVGCAARWCDYLTNGAANVTYLVCFYDPAGNENGVKPYERGVACSQCRAGQSCESNLCTGDFFSCEDDNTNCFLWARLGECQKNPRYMTQRCMKSCGLC